jgi:hypothetical protein
MKGKICPGCGIEKARKEFNYKDKQRGKRQARCRVCTRLQVKRHYQNNRAYYLKKGSKRNWYVRQTNREKMLVYLQGYACVDCGESDIRCLQFDHVKGKKTDSIARLMHFYAWKTLEKEMAKCEVRCASCHQKKTVEKAGWYRALKRRLRRP